MKNDPRTAAHRTRRGPTQNPQPVDSMITDPKTKRGFLLGLWRLLHNQCPRCNSDSPHIYRCGVCNQAHLENGNIVPNRGSQIPYPPTLGTKGLWFYSWVHPHADKKQAFMEEKGGKP